MSNVKRILIIDDDRSILRFFKLILERNGYAADTAATGREALEKIENQFYDVALIDVVLPDMTGLDLISKFPSRTKKIVVTGAFSEENVKRARTDGAEDYLLKPVKPELLLQLIDC
ncbi:MAG: hypothetical protein QG670_399 [Thermoproteota archaeon]|nr:hypothetical protein [Thermoproteota archaeon]